MRIQLQILSTSIRQIVTSCCAAAILLGAVGSVNVCAQEANSTEKVSKELEAAVRAKEMALKELAAQLETQKKVLEQQRKAMEAQLEAQERQFRSRQEEFEAGQHDYKRMQAWLESRGTESRGKEMDYLQMRQRLEAAQAAVAQLQALNRKPPTPLPENAQTRVFELRYSKAPQLLSVIAGIVGDRGLRMAVDERSNSLVVSADDKTMSIVEALLQKLDQSANQSTTPEAAPMETLQLRIIWLLDGVSVSESSNRMVSPQVLDALKQLGFESPAVVCQQINTMTLGDDKGRGRFQFGLPVLVNEQTWQLTGGGSVSPVADHRFGVEFELQCAAPGGGQGANRRSQLGGSIYTPLGHYTVMGTTTFVEPGNEQEGPRQHLSAFVVYLDRAPEFPAAEQAHAEEVPR